MKIPAASRVLSARQMLVNIVSIRIKGRLPENRKESSRINRSSPVCAKCSNDKCKDVIGMTLGSIGDELETSAPEHKAPRAEGGDMDAPRSREHRSAGNMQDDRARAGAMEVVVSHNIEKAMKILKRKLIKEGLFKELKSRRYYEKPSERRKRKEKESRKKARKDEARMKKGPGLM